HPPRPTLFPYTTLFRSISGRTFDGTGSGTVGKASAIDSTADGNYTLVGNGACAIPPVPVSAVSTKTHGAAGTFDIDLPLTGNPGDRKSTRLNSSHLGIS